MACKKLERWEYKTPCMIETALLSTSNMNLCIMHNDESGAAPEWCLGNLSLSAAHLWVSSGACMS